MEEYLQQITRLMNLNGEAVEGMMVVNKDGIVEYYKPGNPFGKLPEEFGRNVGRTRAPACSPWAPSPWTTRPSR